MIKLLITILQLMLTLLEKGKLDSNLIKNLRLQSSFTFYNSIRFIRSLLSYRGLVALLFLLRKVFLIRGFKLIYYIFLVINNLLGIGLILAFIELPTKELSLLYRHLLMAIDSTENSHFKIIIDLKDKVFKYIIELLQSLLSDKASLPDFDLTSERDEAKTDGDLYSSSSRPSLPVDNNVKPGAASDSGIGSSNVPNNTDGKFSGSSFGDGTSIRRHYSNNGSIIENINNFDPLSIITSPYFYVPVTIIALGTVSYLFLF